MIFEVGKMTNSEKLRLDLFITGKNGKVIWNLRFMHIGRNAEAKMKVFLRPICQGKKL